MIMYVIMYNMYFSTLEPHIEEYNESINITITIIYAIRLMNQKNNCNISINDLKYFISLEYSYSNILQ